LGKNLFLFFSRVPMARATPPPMHRQSHARALLFPVFQAVEQSHAAPDCFALVGSLPSSARALPEAAPAIASASRSVWLPSSAQS
jgi:hypothetical protein